MKYNNSAGRLLAHLEYANQLPANDSTFDIWTNVFNNFAINRESKFISDNFSEIYIRLTACVSSLDEIEAIMRVRHPTDLHLYTRNFDHLRRLLAPKSIEAQWSNYKSLLSDAGLMALELCARDLDAEGSVTEDDLTAILNAVHGLRKQVLDSAELPKYVKEWILQLLNALQRSVELYSVKGGRKLREALATLAGEIHFHKADVEEIKKHSPIAEGLSKVFGALSWAAQKGQDIKTMIEYSGAVGDIVKLVINNVQ